MLSHLNVNIYSYNLRSCSMAAADKSANCVLEASVNDILKTRPIAVSMKLLLELSAMRRIDRLPAFQRRRQRYLSNCGSARVDTDDDMATEMLVEGSAVMELLDREPSESNRKVFENLILFVGMKMTA